MQSQGWIIAGIVALPVVVVLVMAIVYYYNRKTTEESWRDFAAHEKLNYQAPLRIEGVYRGRRIVVRSAVKFRLRRKGYYPTDWTRFGMHVNNGSNAWLVISNDDNLSGLGQLIGVHSIELFGKEINLRYAIRAQPKSMLDAISNASNLNTKLDQVNGLITIWLKDHSLYLDHGELITDHEYLLFLLDLMSDLARIIETIDYDGVGVAGGVA